jgi:tetratricopeptide (TPR) repeat protein
MRGLRIALLVLLAAVPAVADTVDDEIVAAWEAFNAGDAGAAIARLKALRAADPEDVRPNARLAYILLMEDGDLDEVEGLLVQHLGAHSEDEWALEHLAIAAERALAVGAPAVARNCAKELKRLVPDEKDYRYLWARACYHMGENVSVAQACALLIDDYPSWALPYWLLARTFADQGQYDEEVEVYRDLLKEQPGNVDARMRMARAQLMRRDYDAAEETYRSALETAEAGSGLREDAQAGLDLVKSSRALTERLRKQDAFLSDVLLGVLAAWVLVVVGLLLATRRGGGGR